MSVIQLQCVNVCMLVELELIILEQMAVGGGGVVVCEEVVASVWVPVKSIQYACIDLKPLIFVFLATCSCQFPHSKFRSFQNEHRAPSSARKAVGFVYANPCTQSCQNKDRHVHGSCMHWRLHCAEDFASKLQRVSVSFSTYAPQTQRSPCFYSVHVPYSPNYLLFELACRVALFHPHSHQFLPSPL